MLRRRLESDADCRCGGDRRHSGGFLLRIMPPSWHPVPACTTRLRCRRAVLLCCNDGAASILKFGPEIKNRCSLWAVLEGFLASILKFGPEIKNRCTQQGINRQNLASILKFGPEIMNRCTKQSIFSTHPQHASSAHPPARVQARILPWVFCMGTGSTVTPQRFDSGGKAGADAPGGGISLCFCRRGCAAPVQKPPRSTPCRSEKNRRNERTAAAKTHPAAKITVATKSSAATKNPSRRCVHHPRHQDGQKYLKESDYSA